MNSIITQKTRYFGHVKRLSGLGRTMMECMVRGRRDRGRQMRRWTLAIEVALGMRLHKAGWGWAGNKLSTFAGREESDVP